MILNNVNIPFGVGVIDSLRIRVKMERVKILDKRLITSYIAYYPSLESLDGENHNADEFGDEFKNPEPYTKIIDGITYRFYPKAFITPKKTAEEYMVFQISAKMLKHSYFDGINKKNIKNLVDDINGLKVIKIELEDFLQGFVSDIDICINQLIGLKPLKIAFGLINNFALAGKKPLINQFLHEKSKNIGIEFNKREKGTNTAPYCKIYHKGFELESKSLHFYRCFLEPMRKSVLDNLVRYEFTIKASKHKKHLSSLGYKAEFKTLNDLLEADQKELTKIAKSGISNYLEKNEKSKINTSDMTPMDIVISFYIEELIKLGFDTEKLLGFQYLIDCRFARGRLKTKTKSLIDNIISVDSNLKKKLEVNESAQIFLRNLGIFNLV